jgi:hypothetical protein
MPFKIEILLIPLLQAISHIFAISEDDHPLKIVGHARDHWWTLDFANAFVSPGVNSRGVLVPSPRAYARNGAARRWLGDKKPAWFVNMMLLNKKETTIICNSFNDVISGNFGSEKVDQDKAGLL